MNLKAKISSYSSSAECKELTNQILEQPTSFDELIQYFFDDDIRLVQRSSNVVNMCIEKQPAVIHPYLDKIIANLDMDTQNTVKRNTLRMLQYIDIPERHLGKLVDFCFKCLDSVKEPVANRVFAMTVLYNIVLKIPELKDELKMMIEDHLPYGTAGFKARGKKILHLLRRPKK